jgi:transketolase
LAGTLALSKLIAADDNGISIDSEKSTIEHWFTDGRPGASKHGWNVRASTDTTSTPSTPRCGQPRR